MPLITVGRRNSGAIRVHYEDDVFNSPVVLIHGAPQRAVVGKASNSPAGGRPPGLSGHANTNEELVSAANAQIAELSKSSPG